MKLITYGVLGYIALQFFGKAKNVVTAYQEIKTKVIGIKNVKFTLAKITFNLDIQLLNETSQDINAIPGNILSLEKVLIYGSDGTFIGTALPPATKIDIPANGLQVIQDIPAFIETKDIQNILYKISQFEKLQIKLVVESLGQTVTL